MADMNPTLTQSQALPASTASQDRGQVGTPTMVAGGSADEDRRLLPPIVLQYWHIARRWRLLIAGIVCACLVAGLVATLLMQPLYTARSQIEISRQQKNVTNVEGLEAPEASRDVEFYATQYSLLKAGSLAERVATAMNLAENDDFFKAHGATPGKDERARLRQVTNLLLANVSIEPIRTSRLVDIKYTSRSPQLSAAISNAWVREFIAASMNREFSSTADARRFLEQRLAELRTRTEESERRLVNFASANNIVPLETIRDPDGRTQTQRTLASADLEAVNQALIAARTERIAAESRAGRNGAGASAEALTNAAITSLRQRRGELAADYARLLTQYEAGYPVARALRNQLDDLDRTIAREEARIASSRQQAYQEALSRERQLASYVQRLRNDLDRQQQNAIQYNIYQREADTNRQLYDSLLQRYKEIGVAGSVGANNIAVVDQAQVPTAPSSPNLPLNMAVALLIGLGLAAAAVLVLEQIDEGIKAPGDVPKLLGLPLLGNVPMTEQDPLEVIEKAKSSFAEAYFSIRSALAFSTSHGLPRSLCIVSNQPSEGKSTSSLALAVTIGRTGQSVLLVDADLRSPSLHLLLESTNDRGFSNLLVGEDGLDTMVVPTRFKGVDVLPCGPMPPSPSELLSSARLEEVVALLQSRYDHVIFDCPPVLGLTDAPLMVRATEGALFVIEAGRSPVRGIRTSLQRLKLAGGSVLGAIVTKINFDRQHYGYSYGYGYGYGSRYGYGYGDGLTYGADKATARSARVAE